MRLTDFLSIAGVLLWAGYELLLRSRADADSATWRGGTADRGTTRLLLAAYAAAVLVNAVLGAVGIGELPGWPRWAGIAMIAAGLALRAWGMHTLGVHYTRTLRTTGGQRLVTDGPYRYIRHPGYCGSLLVWSGYSLGLGNGIAWGVVTVGLLFVYGRRIAAEEEMLLAAFGAEYEEYRSRTRRLVPFLY
ncbi:methyltransferase family protein [Streptomyces sp. NPDC094448]|uniref:methyltransferase family protein n=1 Tax=Streptomyces sp. NPDC094448 TaxID=3366063 RepID=UPI00380C09CB